MVMPSTFGLVLAATTGSFGLDRCTLNVKRAGLELFWLATAMPEQKREPRLGSSVGRNTRERVSAVTDGSFETAWRAAAAAAATRASGSSGGGGRAERGTPADVSGRSTYAAPGPSAARRARQPAWPASAAPSALPPSA